MRSPVREHLGKPSVLHTLSARPDDADTYGGSLDYRDENPVIKRVGMKRLGAQRD